MDFGSALLLFGLDLDLLQGIISFLYEIDPRFRTLEDDDGSFRLDLDEPRIETRPETDMASFRMGVHLTGRLFLGEDPDPRLFDTWVRLRPEVVPQDEGPPVGGLRFDGVEEVVPAIAQQSVEQAFGPDGAIGAALEAFELPVFADLITSAGEQLSPGVEVDPEDFEVAFYLGRPAPIRRPLWDVAKVDGEWQPHLDLDVSHTTTPGLIAAVGLAGSDPVPPAAPSIVRPGTG
ncbi:MAG TPA: hypothetical protein VMM13_19690, partial [Euzebya sp.]|nr:hypothetical protein [Euzebya sp.]